MRKLLAAFAIVAASAAALTSTALADGHLDGAIKARKAIMTLYGANLGPLGAMAKGEMDYDAEAAQAFANNLMAVANIDQRAMWPEGSDSAAMPDKTRALPEIWSNYPDVAEISNALSEASAGLADVAGTGLDALRGGLGPVGKTCGDCHESFRAERS
ncbi:MAG: cytochrome c [Pseudomonadota bacterium]